MKNDKKIEQIGIPAETLRNALPSNAKYLCMGTAGNITYSSTKPVLQTTGWYFPSLGYTCGKLIITEFVGKHWSKCLYEFKDKPKKQGKTNESN